MKNITPILVVAILLCSMPTTAHEFEIDGKYYNIKSSTAQTVEVTYKGNNYSQYNDEYFGHIVIPETITYNNICYKVTDITSYAFKGCSELISVEIPSSVTFIGASAFSDCTKLESINIPNIIASGSNPISGCTKLRSVKYNCNSISPWLRDNTSVEEVVLGDNVESISDYAFSGCSNLKNVICSNSLTYIGKSAFKSCSNLKDFTIPNSVKRIKDQAFSYCTELTNITIPNSVIEIGMSAFSYCTELTNIEISNGVTTIGNGVFSGCASLTSITIPNSVTEINGPLFYGCTNLDSIVIEEGNTVFDSRDKCNAIIRTSTNTLISGCNSTKFPTSISSIGNSALDGCTKITNIEIPNSVTRIGERAFSRCTELVSVTISNNVKSIEYGTFDGCSNLKSITIPNSVTNIGDYAFSGCSSITNIEIPFSVVNIGNMTFYNCSGLKKIELHCPTVNSWFSNNTSIEEVILGDSVENIGYKAFYYCSGLKNITIPNSVIYIGSNAFCGCSNLLDVTIPKSVTSIGTAAFYGCRSLINIEIPNSVTKIQERTFYDCSHLKSVIIPNSITNIGEQAFRSCSSLEKIISFIPEEKLFKIPTSVFSDINLSTCTLYVPSNAIDTYKTTDGWKGFANIQEIKYKVTYIINGEQYVTYDVAEGEKIPLPYKEGHTFLCDEIYETMPAKDITVTGRFIVNKYLLTYKVDGVIFQSDIIAYGLEIEPIREPIREGHTFSGWSEIPETMPAEDITVTGTFTVNKYLLTFIIDGEVYKTLYTDYGSKIEYPIIPGYIIEWNMEDLPETMPDEELIIIGTTTADTSIDSINTDNKEKVVYTIDGLRLLDVENLNRGIYLINGKKVIIR